MYCKEKQEQQQKEEKGEAWFTVFTSYSFKMQWLVPKTKTQSRVGGGSVLYWSITGVCFYVPKAYTPIWLYVTFFQASFLCIC